MMVRMVTERERIFISFVALMKSFVSVGSFVTHFDRFRMFAGKFNPLVNRVMLMDRSKAVVLWMKETSLVERVFVRNSSQRIANHNRCKDANQHGSVSHSLYSIRPPPRTCPPCPC